MPAALSDSDIAHWRAHGYVILEGWLDADELAQARGPVDQIHPDWGRYTADPGRWPQAEHAWLYDHFPCETPAASLHVLNETLADMAATLLDTGDLVVAHGELIAKYAGTADFEQPHHLDYGNNTMLTPPEELEQIPFIWYFDDVTDDLGPTKVLSRQHTSHLPLTERGLPRESHPDLYELEVSVEVPAGSLLVYSMRTYHRGSAMTAAAGARRTGHVTFMRGDVRHAGWRDLSRAGNEARLSELIEQATVRQRTLLGIPAPSDAYWSASRLKEAEARYPKGDWQAYRDAL